MGGRHNEINDESLDQVSGGALLAQYSDEEYEEAGVEVVGSGVIYNTAYKFRGEFITPANANIIVKYYKAFNRVPDSVDQTVNAVVYRQY